MRDKSRKASKAAKASWKARSNANALPVQSDGKAIKEIKEIKEKIKKENEQFFSGFNFSENLKDIIYDFIVHREELGKTMTRSAITAFANGVKDMKEEEATKAINTAIIQ